MPRFHFEITDGHTLPDPSGMELPTEDAAKRAANEIAKQIAMDDVGTSLRDVVVKTDDGREIYKTRIKAK